MTAKASFSDDLWRYLRALRKNNSRDWFEANRDRYERELLDPALDFINDFGPRLRKISKQFDAIPRKSGGSLFRIYRDVRFSKDKSPYKTHVGIQFRHSQHRDAHAPGFYLHLEPDGCFAGIGTWRPDSASLAKIRDAIADDGTKWRRAKGGKAFKEHLDLRGESLKRPPKGFDPDHPLIEDLKRKSFIAVTELDNKSVTSLGLLDRYEELCRAGAPLVRFLCGALEVEY